MRTREGPIRFEWGSQRDWARAKQLDFSRPPWMLHSIPAPAQRNAPPANRPAIIPCISIWMHPYISVGTGCGGQRGNAVLWPPTALPRTAIPMFWFSETAHYFYIDRKPPWTPLLWFSVNFVFYFFFFTLLAFRISLSSGCTSVWRVFGLRINDDLDFGSHSSHQFGCCPHCWFERWVNYTKSTWVTNTLEITFVIIST